MSELKQLRSEFFREALASGWYTPGLASATWQASIGPERLAAWYRRLYEPPSGLPPVGMRLLNKFAIGADPEFKFFEGNLAVHASNFKLLKAGAAFGADNNGRLIEFRAHPSRSALSVLASLWLAIRWMGAFEPKTLTYTWRSGAYAEGDGLGGHIHFGRKQVKLRDRELSALDHITHLMLVAGIFDKDEAKFRFRKSQGGHYGGPSDYRRQPHGWEYRTLPSWMDAPWLAYLSLTLGKLAVAMPETIPPLSPSDHFITYEQARGRLRLILAFFAPLDDDARFAFTILSRHGFPTHASGIDIKSNWGLFPNGPLGQGREAKPPQVIPGTIEPSPAELSELAAAMFEGRTPDLLPLTPSWSPTQLPQDYIQCIRTANTHVAPGVGEFCLDLCTHKDSSIIFTGTGTNRVFALPSNFEVPRSLNAALRDLNLGYHIGDSGCLGVCAKNTTPEKLAQGKKVLLDSGVYPLWRIDEVKSDSYKLWRGKKSSTPSKLLFDSSKPF